jgi:hypothetical protein
MILEQIQLEQLPLAQVGGRTKPLEKKSFEQQT